MNKTASVIVLLGVSLEATVVLPLVLVNVPPVIVVSQSVEVTRPPAIVIVFAVNVPVMLPGSLLAKKEMVKFVSSFEPKTEDIKSDDASELLINWPLPPVILPVSSPTNVIVKVPVKLPGLGQGPGVPLVSVKLIVPL